MPPKQLRQGYQAQLRVNTRASTRTLNRTIEHEMESSISKRSKPRGKDAVRVSIVTDNSVQAGKHSTKSTPLRKLSENVSLRNRANAKRVDSSTPVQDTDVGSKYSTLRQNVEQKATTDSTPLNALKTMSGLPLSVKSVSCDGTKTSGLKTTPHKSRKTPKKSPKELSSPKSRYATPTRLSKTSRKLTLTMETLKTSNGKNNSSRLSFTVVKQGLRKFSKSPKIALPSSKRKAKSPISPESNISDHWYRLSPETPGIVSTTEERSKRRVKEKLSSSKMSLALKTPVVVLQRLPNTDSKTIRRPLPRQSSGKPERSYNVASVEAASTRATPAILSLPCDRKQGVHPNEHESIFRSRCSVSECNKSFDTRNDNGETVGRFEASSPKGHKTLETRKETILSVDSGQHDEVDGKNRTYELLEPETPDLRDKLNRKRSSHVARLGEKESKETPKVRFVANTASDSFAFDTMQLRSSFKKSKRSLRTGNVMRISPIKHSQRSPLVSSRRRSNSVSNGKLARKPISRVRQRSKSFSNVNIEAEKPPSGSAKKADPKYTTPKGMPNFAGIHKRIFSKSESLVDAQKRIETRHRALTATKSNLLNTINSPRGRNSLTGPSTNGPYNRFGFKIRKIDATDCILRKCTLHSRSEKERETNRTILKGVRTNRRFELQMKSRKVVF